MEKQQGISFREFIESHVQMLHYFRTTQEPEHNLLYVKKIESSIIQQNFLHWWKYSRATLYRRVAACHMWQCRWGTELLMYLLLINLNGHMQGVTTTSELTWLYILTQGGLDTSS